MDEMNINITIDQTSFNHGNLSLENPNVSSQTELYMSSKIVVTIYSILFIISSIGNTTVFLSLVKNRNRKLRINLMILNLTIADLIVTYIMIPLEICWRITNEWLAGDFVCRIMQAFRAFGPYLSSMVLVCISLDRYFAVIHPLKVNDAHRRSKIMLMFAWLTSIACSVPQTIVFHTESHPMFPNFVQCVSYNSLTEWQEILYSTFGIAALYLIPLVIIIFCYARILWKIYKRSIQSSKDNQSNNTNVSLCQSPNQPEYGCTNRRTYFAKNRFHLRRSDLAQIEKARIRTLRMTIIIVMAFVWCWTPYASIVLLFHFYKPQVENMHKDLKDALFMFAVSNSCVNPLVYGSYTMNFRQVFCRYIYRLLFWKRKTNMNTISISNRLVYLEDNSSYSQLNPSTPLFHNNMKVEFIVSISIIDFVNRYIVYKLHMMVLYNLYRTLLFKKNKISIWQKQRFCTMSSKKALIVLTEGAEEMELVITADVLRRAQIDTTIAGLNTSNPIKCSRNIVIVPDANLNNVKPEDFDAFILPGGMKAANTFAKDESIGKILKQFEQSKKVIGVICASPIALNKHKIGFEKRITSHPSIAEQLTNYKYCEDRVVNECGLITSRGPGTAFEFALEIVKQLVGEKKVKEIVPSMMLK